MAEYIRTVQLGAVTVTAINVGDIQVPYTDWLNVSPEERSTHDTATLIEPVRMPIQCFHLALPGTSILVDAGFYDGGSVNRSVRPDNTVRHDVEIQVIQFQIDPARRREQYPPIPIERTSVTGLRHLDGALSMARSGPDTATASFSIVIDDQPELNFGGRRNADGEGLAVFGRVTRGMDVVKTIQASPTGSQGPYGTESPCHRSESSRRTGRSDKRNASLALYSETEPSTDYNPVTSLPASASVSSNCVTWSRNASGTDSAAR